MGVKGLWDIVGEGEITSLAALATEFLQEHGRPMRIAIDEAAWRFNNLNKYQVEAIQEKVEAAHPIEKAIFHRIIALLQLNIHLIFVFDGERRPHKRGRVGGNKTDYNRIELFVRMLDVLQIPHHKAPGEAEAECALMRREGLVDAVWSEDGDSLMFGCGILFRNHREKKNAKSKTHVRVWREEEILRKKKLDREGMILVAMLSGGDYAPAGVHGCGPRHAMKAVRAGFGKSLCRINTRQEAQRWNGELARFFFSDGIDVPFDFPDLKTLDKYRNPTVCTAAQLQNLRGLRDGWERPINEPELRRFMRLYFNIWTKGYIRHVLPVLLVKSLWATKYGEHHRNARFEIQPKKVRRKKKDGPEVPLETKITFLPEPTTSLDLSRQPDGDEEEDWAKLDNKSDGSFDPFARVECEVLNCVLLWGAPDVLNAAVAAQTPAATATTTKAKSKRGQGEQATASASPRKRKADAEPTESGPKKRKRAVKPKSTPNPIPVPPLSPEVAGLASSPRHPNRTIIDLDSESDRAPTTSTEFRTPIPISLPKSQKTPQPVQTSNLNVREQVRASWANRERQLREMASPAAPPASIPSSKPPKEIEVIDLT